MLTGSPVKRLKLSNNKEQIVEMRLCLSPMANNNQTPTTVNYSPNANKIDTVTNKI